MGHGDSAIIEYRTDTGVHFGLVDSNCSGPGAPPALTKLQALGAQELSFVVLTHPHSDHYKGLLSVIEAYRGRIGAFYSFPLGAYLSGQLKRLAEVYQQVHDSTDSPTIRGRTLEFVQILAAAKNDIPDWEEPTGWETRLAPRGFSGVEVSSILPPAKVKGYYFDALRKGSFDLVEDRLRENQLSLALKLNYAGQQIILGGDGTFLNWLDQKRHCERASTTLEATVVKLPHHGAKEDCQPSVVEHLFRQTGPRYACISADGHSHPHAEVYATLEARGIQPYCTNLATQCGASLSELISAPEFDPVLARFINAVAERPTRRAIQPCQGDITISIDSMGCLTIAPQYDHPCPYRGDLDFLAAL